MSRGKKLDIFIGANIEDEWAEVCPTRKSTVSDKILEPSEHFLIFKKEKRRGKTVTVVGEFHMPKNDMTTILKNLKKKLGCGGTIKNGWMEFQGDIKEKLKTALLEKKFRFKNQRAI